MSCSLLALVGVTATGKSALAVDLAAALASRGRPAEIVNADSMLVYRGMDIGTAKPSMDVRRRVPHHLIDIMPVTQAASVADFQRLARAAIADCQARGVLPILVGGSALYVRAILDDFDFPPTDAGVRQRLEAELAGEGAQALHGRLARLAPDVAAGILPTNGRRVARALEALELTGSFRSTLPPWEYMLPGVLQVGLRLPRDDMDDRITRRVEQMWVEGFVAEVEGLVQVGLREGVTASRALGYQQILAAFDGDYPLAEARPATVRATKRFARKQLGWFARDPRIQWLPALDPGAVDSILGMLENR